MDLNNRILVNLMRGGQTALIDTDLWRCKVCMGRVVYDPEASESICSGCGTVFENMHYCFATCQRGMFGDLQTTVESDRKLLHEIDLPTIIGRGNFDSRGNGISGSYDLFRMRKLDRLLLSRDSKRKSLTKAMTTIRRATEMLGAGDAVADAAYQIYRKFNDGKGSKRKAIVDFAIASVQVALKELKIARSVHELEQVAKEMNARRVRNYYNFLLSELKIHSTSSDASYFVSRIAARAGLNGKVERRAIDILFQVKENPVLASKKPVPLAASALYLAAQLCNQPVTQLRIAGASEVTPVTIRKRSLEIQKILESSLERKSAEKISKEKVLDGLLTFPSAV